MKLYALALTFLCTCATLVLSSGASTFEDKCIAQLEVLDAPENDCEGCTHSLIASKQDADACESPCQFTYVFSQICNGVPSAELQAWAAPCGNGGNVTWDCGPGTSDYAGVRAYCAPCEQ